MVDCHESHVLKQHVRRPKKTKINLVNQKLDDPATGGTGNRHLRVSLDTKELYIRKLSMKLTKHNYRREKKGGKPDPFYPLTRIISPFKSSIIQKLRFQYGVHSQECLSQIWRRGSILIWHSFCLNNTKIRQRRRELRNMAEIKKCSQTARTFSVIVQNSYFIKWFYLVKFDCF